MRPGPLPMRFSRGPWMPGASIAVNSTPSSTRTDILAIAPLLSVRPARS